MQSHVPGHNIRLSVRFAYVFRVVTHPGSALSCGCEIIVIFIQIFKGTDKSKRPTKRL